jgi:hypothetical protein
MSKYRLPVGYNTRENNDSFFDAPHAVVFQPHVYDLALYVATRSGAKRVIDIGSGSAAKLADADRSLEIICLDTADVEPLVRSSLSNATFVPCDLENGVLAAADASMFDGAVVICADVLEHLRQPDRLARDLAQIQTSCRWMLISTPDRVRARGLLDNGPPKNTAHTMEWAADEFGRFLVDCGFSGALLLGHTMSDTESRAKNTILALSGKEAGFEAPDRCVSVAAIMHVYNERDAIGPVAQNLFDQGVDVHLIDSWSDDGSFELGQQLVDQRICVSVTRFPPEPCAQYDVSRLDFTARYAASLSADWVLYHEADEIFSAPWRSARLKDALSFVDTLGYNAVDFIMIDFFFTHYGKPIDFDPTTYRWFDWGRRPEHLCQIKAWKNAFSDELHLSGGHSAGFHGERLYPLKFLSKRYSLRSYPQANRKILTERVERERRGSDWCIHHEAFKGFGEIAPWRKFELTCFNPLVFETEFLVERLSGIGIEREPQLIPSVETLHRELAATRRRAARSDELSEATRRTLEAMRLSASWRLTKPLRSIESWIARRWQQRAYMQFVAALEREFDPAWYRERYLGSGSVQQPLDHYLKDGLEAGNSPNTWFDEGYYVARYPDVQAAIAAGGFCCGFEHYLAHGRYENRMPLCEPSSTARG